MYKFMDFGHLMLKKTGKKQNYVKKVDFGQIYMKFAVATATSKLIDIQLMNEWAASENLSFFSKLKTLTPPPPPRHPHVRPREQIAWQITIFCDNKVQ